jgi:hypothetical protein
MSSATLAGKISLSHRNNPPNWASQIRTAFASIAWNTGSSSPGELLMTCSTSEVAVPRPTAQPGCCARTARCDGTTGGRRPAGKRPAEGCDPRHVLSALSAAINSRRNFAISASTLATA